MFKYFFISLFLLLNTVAYSQSWDNLMQNVVDYQKEDNIEGAIGFGEKALAQAEKEFGKISENYATTLNVLALLYTYTGNYTKAELLYLDAIKIRKDVNKENNSEYVSTLFDLARLYQITGDYSKSEKLYLEVLKIGKQFLGDKHFDYAQSIKDLAGLYYKMGNYKKSEFMYLEVIKIKKDVLGENHLDYTSSLDDIAVFYQVIGEYKKAEPIFLDVQRIIKKLLGENHTEYAKSLKNLASLYEWMGKYAKSEELYLQSLKIIREVQGEKHLDYAHFINDIALFYKYIGDYTKAEQLFLESLKIRKQILGESHQDYANSLSNLADLYRVMGNYTKSESLFIEALEIIRKILGEKSLGYSTILNNLALLYDEAGNYTKAEPLYYESLNIAKMHASENNIIFVSTLNNLATLYYKIGNYSKGELLLMKSLEISKEMNGGKGPKYANILNNLAMLYWAMGDYIKAEPLCYEAYQIKKELLGNNHPSYAQSLNNLALLYFDAGEYVKAEPFFIEALEIQNKNFGEKHPEYALTLGNLAYLYDKMGDYSKSERLFIKALKIKKEVLDEKHPDYAVSLKNLAMFYSAHSDYEKAEPLLLEANKNYIYQINSYFPIFSETEKEKFLNTIDYNFNIFYSFCLDYYKDKPEISFEINNLHLSTKGVILSSMNRVKEAVSKSSDAGLIALSDKLVSTKKSLYNASLLSLEEQTKRSINFTELENEANNLEKELSRKSDEYRELLESKDINYEQIQNSLSNDEAVVEFIDFRYWNKRWTDTTYYIALITRPGYKTPALVQLCTEDEIGSKLNFTPAEVIRGFDPENEIGSVLLSEKYKSIYNLIWKPLEEHLQGCSTVYISPSGGLNKISFAALSPDGSSYLIDKINIRYTGNPRDIVSEKKREEQVVINSAVLFGGAYYDTDAENLKSYQRSGEISEKREIINPFVYTNDKDILIGKENPTDRGNIWTYLPGTLQEVKDIGGLLSNKGITTILDTGYYANEQNLKLLSGSEDVQILHISTHGFFFSDAEKDYSKTMMGITDSKQIIRILDNPLYRSGIVLSGAENYIENKETKPGETLEDGIITAYEISLLDLSNTELAVLSACETGLGDIKGGEGVYGLQRSFKTTGAKNVIISLWKVPDKETGELMKLFYENWLIKGMNKRDALIEAQKEMKKKNPNPYYWAAFVMM